MMNLPGGIQTYRRLSFGLTLILPAVSFCLDAKYDPSPRTHTSPNPPSTSARRTLLDRSMEALSRQQRVRVDGSRRAVCGAGFQASALSATASSILQKG